jgi:hypothetical protein
MDRGVVGYVRLGMNGMRATAGLIPDLTDEPEQVFNQSLTGNLALI